MFNPDTPDEELIRRWQAGEESAFDVLYERHVLALLSIAAHKTGDREAAKELVQDTFISLYDHKAGISEQTPLRSYLYVTLKRKIFNHYRSRLVHQKYELHVSHRQSEADYSTELAIETRELEKLIENEIDKLPAQCRLVFRLSRKEHLSHKEIAAQLGISENTVKQHIRKALGILRGSLGEVLELAAFIYLLKN